MRNDIVDRATVKCKFFRLNCRLTFFVKFFVTSTVHFVRTSFTIRRMSRYYSATGIFHSQVNKGSCLFILHITMDDITKLLAILRFSF